jgi:hypothetical protein
VLISCSYSQNCIHRGQLSWSACVLYWVGMNASDCQEVLGWGSPKSCAILCELHCSHSGISTGVCSPWTTNIHICSRCRTSSLMETQLWPWKHINVWTTSTRACRSMCRVMQDHSIRSDDCCVHCVFSTPNSAVHISLWQITLLRSTLPYLTVTCILKTKRLSTS